MSWLHYSNVSLIKNALPFKRNIKNKFIKVDRNDSIDMSVNPRAIDHKNVPKYARNMKEC